MSIRSYFTPKDDPRESLSSCLPSQAIALANKEVEKVTGDKGKQRGQYRRRANTLLPIFVAMTIPDFFYSDSIPILNVSTMFLCTHGSLEYNRLFRILRGRSLEFLGVANVHVLKMFRVKKFLLPGWATKIF